ncbi:hypothetical protein [Sinomonas sp. ASV322]|uniref:hypothetical protein n=1 Tax=Sinomonas sp. ASV322 TaxID=3041920 RepID=UPI0027DC27E6|nr:hypothetical protein [Sinomonas sp. ASV322]MDQ4503575.1 hypothetical protein [Sinomonas sp. ASV322]
MGNSAHSVTSATPGILFGAAVSALLAFYAFEAATSSKPLLWVVWGLLAACSSAVVVEMIRYQAAGGTKPRWLNAAGAIAFVLAVAFGQFHQYGG